MVLRHHRCRPGTGVPTAANALAIALTTRSHRSAGPHRRRPRPPRFTSPPSVTHALTSSYRARASPKLSNPGPRFAEVAGTRTVDRSMHSADHCTADHCTPITRADHCKPSAAATASAATGSTVGVLIQLNGGVRVLQAVPVTVQTTTGSAEPPDSPGQQPAVGGRGQQPGNGRRGGGLDEHPLRGGQQPGGCQDLLVGDGSRSDRATRPARRWRHSRRRARQSGSRVAMVSGWQHGWPSTSGAAPAAWKPNILGSASMIPSRWYSR